MKKTADPGRRALALEPMTTAHTLTRLRRIEGQVRGLQRMVEDERTCAEVLTQIASVHEALRAVGRELMRHHIKHCATAAIASGSDDAEQMCDALVDLMYRHIR